MVRRDWPREFKIFHVVTNNWETGPSPLAWELLELLIIEIGPRASSYRSNGPYRRSISYLLSQASLFLLRPKVLAHVSQVVEIPHREIPGYAQLTDEPEGATPNDCFQERFLLSPKCARSPLSTQNPGWIRLIWKSRVRPQSNQDQVYLPIFGSVPVISYRTLNMGFYYYYFFYRKM